MFDVTSAVGDADDDDALIGDELDDDEIVAIATDNNDDDDDLEDDDLVARDQEALDRETDLTSIAESTPRTSTMWTRSRRSPPTRSSSSTSAT